MILRYELQVLFDLWWACFQVVQTGEMAIDSTPDI